jgi:addiction module RelE/StbE family toxin
MQVNWTKSALRDLEIEANYLNKINPSIESNFLEHVESSVTLIKKYPELGRIGRVNQTRELILKKFQYILIYLVIASCIDIIRLLHTSRKWPNSL